MKKADYISSRSNPRIKWVASLCEKKNRNSSRSFIAEGEKLLMEALGAGLDITHIFLREQDAERILGLISKYDSSDKYRDTEIITVHASVFEKISTEKSPEGVITVIKYLDFFRNIDIIYKEEFFYSAGERTLALYSVRDPGNLGSVIRSATAFGVEHIVLSSDCADVYNPKTVRSAMGCLFKVRISIVSDFSSFIEATQAVGRRVFAAELADRAVSLTDISLLSSDIFVIGNEGHGIPREISDKCSSSVFIPISQKAESLNASVAAAMFMWEQNKISL